MATIKRLIEKQNELLTQAVAEIKSMALTLEEQRAAVVSLDEEVKKRSEDMYKIFRVQCEVIRGIIFGTGLNKGKKLKEGIEAGIKAMEDISEITTEPKSEASLFDGMNKAVADFDKACTKAGFKCAEQKKRPKGDILREATERNLISIDGLRMRYGWNKPAIIKAINFYKWPIEKIEGSKLDYVDKSHIFILKEYFTPVRQG